MYTLQMWSETLQKYRYISFKCMTDAVRLTVGVRSRWYLSHSAKPGVLRHGTKHLLGTDGFDKRYKHALRAIASRENISSKEYRAA